MYQLFKRTKKVNNLVQHPYVLLPLFKTGNMGYFKVYLFSSVGVDMLQFILWTLHKIYFRSPHTMWVHCSGSMNYDSVHFTILTSEKKRGGYPCNNAFRRFWWLKVLVKGIKRAVKNFWSLFWWWHKIIRCDIVFI